MFKLPALPSSQADIAELCDFAEILSWEQGSTSLREILAFLGRVDENDHNIGCDDDESQTSDLLDDVMLELERRSNGCGSGYPFELKSVGTVLKHRRAWDSMGTVYRYLLLSTRLNMQSAKKHAGIDGTTLLETLSANVLQEHLGEKSQAIVFGTANGDSNFVSRINDVCRRLGEGVGFTTRTHASVKVTAQDDKLDTIAWLPFADRLPGQIIVFGQCKTGTNWPSLVSQLQPIAFIKRWFKESFVVDPVRAFFVSEAPGCAEWSDAAIYAGVLFDRCRIVSLSKSADTAEISKWTKAAFDSFSLSDVVKQGTKKN